ncbi:MAG TPA: lysylphosphatidylglycerol synthase transmembrane domain-containing protein [Terriglobales bacterium]|nr:lysylphosphatidylglycerol synthase transmembrane domain-containing protein [Terriglobales bacterium]
MTKNRFLAYGIVLAILVLLVYLQFREWRTFDWNKFIAHSREITWRHVIHGIILIYLGYFLRAVRWKIFLRPVRKDVSAFSLISPTLVGFTGLAVLGRPGELIRPYLIARRVNLSFSSQLAVWAIERIFDLAAFTVLMVAAIFLPTKLRAFAAGRPAYYHWLHVAGYLLSGLVVALFAVAMFVNYKGPAIAAWVEIRFSHLAKNLGHRIAQRVREFAGGLNTIHGPISFIQIFAVSVLMWWLIALSYKEVTHAYGAPMQQMSVTRVFLLMGSSMVGSMLQLPGVGGGSQLATIEALDKVFQVPRELAVSCGILLWLVSFVAVLPVGLLLAHHERLSLRKVAEESERAEATEAVPTSPVIDA